MKRIVGTIGALLMLVVPATGQDYAYTQQPSATTIWDNVESTLQDINDWREQANQGLREQITNLQNQLVDLGGGPTDFSDRAYEALNHEPTFQDGYDAAKDRVNNAADAVMGYMSEKLGGVTDSIRDFSGSRSPQSVACDTCYMNSDVMNSYRSKYGEPSQASTVSAGFGSPGSSESTSGFNVGGGSAGGSIAIR